MKTRVIRIGNSRGIRIPKTLLDQCRLGEAVEIEVQGNQLVVSPATKPRSGWEEVFRRMHQLGDDRLLDRDTLPATQWDRSEWRW